VSDTKKKSYAAWATEVALKSLLGSSPPARTKKKTSFTFVVDSLPLFLTEEHFASILILFYVASCCDTIWWINYVVQNTLKQAIGVLHCGLAIYI
jgi:hypothetical protein